MADQEIAVVLKLIADEFKKELSSSKGLIGDFQRVLSDWKTQAAGIGGALLAVAKSTANYGDEALKAAQKTGTTVESFTALRFAAEQSGLESQQFQQLLVQLNRHLGEAAGGSDQVARTFKTLGVEFQDSQGHLQATDVTLLKVAERFKAMGPSTEATALALQLFGKSGAEAMQFLFEGSDGIGRFMDEAKRLGIVMSQEDAKAADAFNDELDKLQASFRGLTILIGTPLLDPLRQFVELMKDGVAAVGPIARQALIGLHDIMDRLATKFRQAAVAWEFFTGKLSFGDQVQEIQRLQQELDERAATRLLDMDGNLAKPLTGAAKPPQGGGVILADQEKVGAKIRDAAISLAKTREEIERILGRDQEGLGRAIVFNAQGDEAFLATLRREQEMLGRVTVENATAAFRERERIRLEDHDREIDQARAMLAETESLYASSSVDIANARIAVFEAQRKKELDDYRLTEEAKNRIEAEFGQRIKREQAFSDPGLGLVQGLTDYIRDHDSAFGLLRDMARSTAQAMQGFFQKFFLDAIEGRLRSFKDVVRGVMDFVKTLLVQVAAQVATIMTLRLILAGGTAGASLGTDAGLLSLWARDGGLIKRFRGGGSVFANGDQIPALLARGEYVVSRRGVEALDRINRGESGAAAPARTSMTINVHGVPPGHHVRAGMLDDLQNQVVNIYLENLAANGALRRAFGA